MKKGFVIAGLMFGLILSHSTLFAVDIDNDGDGFSQAQWDCNDEDPTVHPEAIEVCLDGIDQNCDGVDLKICLEDSILINMVASGDASSNILKSKFQLLEKNGDGKIGMEEAVNALQVVSGLGGGGGKDFDGDQFTAAMGDMDDTDPNVFPGSIEICGDGIDQDCTGSDLLCAEDLDADEDGYTPNDGDCNDRLKGVYPGSFDILADGIDQDCNGCDAKQVWGLTYVYERFTSDEGGFILWDNYSVSSGRFNFHGAGTSSIYRNIWNGGINPSNSFTPSDGHTNYFEDFYVFTDTYWLSGSDTAVYGFFFCSKPNSEGDFDHLLFLIDKSGYYSIYEYDGSYNYLDGGFTFLLSRSTQANKIAVEKKDNNFRFFIDDLEVKRMVIEGYPGGGLGIITSDNISAAYDDFKITQPTTVYEQTCSADEFPPYTVSNQNEYLNRLMKSVYLWYDQVPNLDISTYTSPEALLEDLVYEELDKWSYITTKEEYESHYEEGQYIGFGFSSRYDRNNNMRIAFVYPGSPADVAGMERGDQILEVNGKAMSVIDRQDSWDSIYGERELGVSSEMMLKTPEGNIKIITMEKGIVDEKTVLHHEIINIEDRKIGYLVFKGFIDNSRTELADVFTIFANAGINELILDLRYNGGGRLSIAKYLGGLIGGQKVVDKIFEEMIYNTNNQHLNYTYTFEQEVNALSLDRVLFITSGSTASASESVIVGLKPFMETVLIGETTAGKPVGSSTFEIGDKYISAIQFKGRNADGEQEFYDGFNPDCQADDEMLRAFGDREEASLKTALDYIQSGTCPAKISQSSRLLSRKVLEFKGFQAEIGAF